MKTIKVIYEFSVEDNADPETVADKVFDLLCDQEDAPYWSCDTWDMAMASTRRTPMNQKEA